MAVPSRQVAYKIWISSLLNSEYVKQEGEWDPNYFLIGDKKVSRINIIATVIDKNIQEDGSYGYLEVDDGSSRVKIKAWREDVKFFQKVDVGEMVLVIGRPRKFNEEVYITPEIIRLVTNYGWAKLRKLELEKEYGKPVEIVKKITEEVKVEKVEQEVNVHSIRQKLLDLIHKQEEISYDSLVSESGISGEEVDKVVKELVKEGEIFFPRPQYIRAV